MVQGPIMPRSDTGSVQWWTGSKNRKPLNISMPLNFCLPKLQTSICGTPKFTMCNFKIIKTSILETSNIIITISQNFNPQISISQSPKTSIHKYQYHSPVKLQSSNIDITIPHDINPRMSISQSLKTENPKNNSC